MANASRIAKALPVCPQTPEENWRKTAPEQFFLPEAEVLTVTGQPYLESQSQELAGALKVKRFSATASDFKNRLAKSECTLALANAFEEQNAESTILISLSHGNVEVWEGEQTSKRIELTSQKQALTSTIDNSSIGLALAERMTASCPHALFVKILKTSLKKPVQIYILNQLEPDFAQTYSRINIEFEDGVEASMTIFEGGSHFGMHRHDVRLGQGSSVKAQWIHIRSEKTSSGKMLAERTVTLAAGAQWDDAQFFAPNGTWRVISNIIARGENANSNCAVSVVAGGQCWLDYEPIQQHVTSNAKSSLNAYMLLGGRARALFQGLIVAERNAENTIAIQENKNLLVGGRARVDASPRLQISPMDVMCKHGSASGEIDSQQLYYLMTRGIPEADAREMILNSFAQQGFVNLGDNHPLHELITSHLQKLIKHL